MFHIDNEATYEESEKSNDFVRCSKENDKKRIVNVYIHY